MPPGFSSAGSFNSLPLTPSVITPISSQVKKILNFLSRVRRPPPPSRRRKCEEEKSNMFGNVPFFAQEEEEDIVFFRGASAAEIDAIVVRESEVSPPITE